LAKPRRYDWIVSNPPVHRGQPDAFDTVAALISGARRRLRPSGVLWIVAQEQVPIGRMLEVHGTFAWAHAALSEDGRFVVWSAGGRRPKGDRHLPECGPIEPHPAHRAAATPAVTATTPASKATAKAAKRSLKRRRVDRDGVSAGAQPKKSKGERTNGV